MRPGPNDELDERPEDADEVLRPSKSARKRAAHAAQALGEELIGLKPHELESLQLPEELYDAVREAQRIRNTRGGMARQRQYIGKLMREIDSAPIEAALAVKRKTGALR